MCLYTLPFNVIKCNISKTKHDNWDTFYCVYMTRLTIGWGQVRLASDYFTLNSRPYKESMFGYKVAVFETMAGLRVTNDRKDFI